MRQQLYLQARYRAMFGYMGEMLVILGLLQLVPLLLIPFYPDEAPLAGAFLLAGLPLIIAGALAWKYYLPKEPVSFTLQEGTVVVVIIWLLAIFTATIPFIAISGLTFSQAVFETTSGWTTTGLSVVDVGSAPKLILFFRSFIQFAGGAGFAIIALSAVAGAFGASVVAAEGRTDQLAPHVRSSAAIVLRIYIGYAVGGILALRAAGMGWFDSVNHAFTALATGGFSTRPESVGYWDSPAIEAVLCILMLLGGINFVTAYALFKGKFGPVFRNGEVRLGGVLVVLGTVLMAIIVTSPLYTADKAARVAIFETISALTGTGFNSIPTYHVFNDFGWLIIIILMCVGGSTGSTAGALKLQRVYILYKAIVWEVRRSFMPRHMVNEPAIWQGEKRELLNDRLVRQVALYIGMYVVVLLIGGGILSAHGYPMRESLFEFASSLGNVGLTGGITSPDMPTTIMWVLPFGMLLGRLEIFAVIIGTVKLLADLKILVLRGRGSS